MTAGRGPFPIKGSEFIIPIDTVIAAVGQVPEAAFVQEVGCSVKKTGVIEISPETAATNVEGVFAGGDSVGGQAFVADAIAGGKLGALAVYCFLEGKDMSQEFQKHQIGNQGSFSFQHFRDPGLIRWILKKQSLLIRSTPFASPTGADITILKPLHRKKV